MMLSQRLHPIMVSCEIIQLSSYFILQSRIALIVAYTSLTMLRHS